MENLSVSFCVQTDRIICCRTRMWQPDTRQPGPPPRLRGGVEWWILLVVALLLVALWPPSEDRSLAMKFVNWAVDPTDALPTLPDPLDFAQGDDVASVEAHDLQVRMYDEAINKGGLTRLRMALKDAEDPFNKATERQLLVAIGVLVAFLVWRSGGTEKK
jgi:hypothetical protein